METLVVMKSADSQIPEPHRSSRHGQHDIERHVQRSLGDVLLGAMPVDGQSITIRQLFTTRSKAHGRAAIIKDSFTFCI